MAEEIIFSKVQFEEHIGYNYKSILILNLKEKELIYQVYEKKKVPPVITKVVAENIFNTVEYWNIGVSAKIVKNNKTEFKPVLLQDKNIDESIIYSYGKKLNAQEYGALKCLSRVIDFEPFRDRKMSMEDKGYIGYRDEVRLTFSAVSESYYPYIELPMYYYYHEDYIWPSEKLYRFLITEILKKDKKATKWVTGYGGHSLFW